MQGFVAKNNFLPQIQQASLKLGQSAASCLSCIHLLASSLTGGPLEKKEVKSVVKYKRINTQ